MPAISPTMEVGTLVEWRIAEGESFSLIWSSGMEVRPEFINERYGRNDDERVCVVEFAGISALGRV